MAEECPDNFRPLRKPDNTSIPFFAYGIFKEKEIAWPRIEKFVERSENYELDDFGLKIRNGLAIAVAQKSAQIAGSIHYSNSNNDKLYETICSSEPDSQFEWKIVDIPKIGSVNLLVGKKPNKDTSEEIESDWSSSKDEAFGYCLKYISKVVEENEPSLRDPNPLSNERSWYAFFAVQSVYLLTWSVLERYLRLALGEDMPIFKKLAHLSGSDDFKESLDQVPTSSFKAYDSRSPNRGEPKTKLEDWYLIRNNVAHRGKDSFKNRKLLPAATELLAVLNIFFPEVIFGLSEHWRMIDYQPKNIEKSK